MIFFVFYYQYDWWDSTFSKLSHSTIPSRRRMNESRTREKEITHGAQEENREKNKLINWILECSKRSVSPGALHFTCWDIRAGTQPETNSSGEGTQQPSVRASGPRGNTRKGGFKGLKFAYTSPRESAPGFRGFLPGKELCQRIIDLFMTLGRFVICCIVSYR